MENFNAANAIQDLQYFEFGGVNPSISDSSTYTFLSAKTMFDTFEGNAEGCYLYSRHSSPMEFIFGTSSCQNGRYRNCQCNRFWYGHNYFYLASNLQSGDHIVSARTIYGGTYAFYEKIFFHLIKLKRVL